MFNPPVKPAMLYTGGSPFSARAVRCQRQSQGLDNTAARGRASQALLCASKISHWLCCAGQSVKAQQHVCGLICCLSLCLLPAEIAGAEGIQYVVQISDLHLSQWRLDPRQWNQFGDREGDLQLWTETVLPVLQPDAMLLTGDLVDGKERHGHGQQLKSEWQAYQHVLDGIRHATSLPDERILDIRGNHDDFNTPTRNGPGDLFASVSTGWRNASSRVQTTFLPGKSADAGSAARACPAAALVAIDLVPSPGLRGPTNFFGIATPALLDELDAALDALAAASRNCKNAPIIISYGHYPLGTAYNGQAVKHVLMHHHVSAYLAGHLHSSVGQRTHRLHPAEDHAGYLAELETAAWKDARRFRILAVDNNSLSFADYYLQTPSRPVTPSQTRDVQQRQHANISYAITAEDAASFVGDYFVLITNPADGRYSPLMGARRAEVGEEQIRALVLPSVAVSPEAEVWMTWKTDTQQTGQASLLCKHEAGRALCAAAVPAQWATLRPDTQLSIQVFARMASSQSPVSSSALRPLQLRSRVGGPVKPLPLQQGLAERYVLQFDWPSTAAWLFHLIWALLAVGCLIVPRLACRHAYRWLPSLQGGSIRSSASVLAWPLHALMDAAAVDMLWYPQVIYAAYLLVGPWLIGSVLTDRPLAAVTRGRVFWWLDGMLVTQEASDTFVAGCFLIGTVVLPLTLWTASLASQMLQQQQHNQQVVDETGLTAAVSTLGTTKEPRVCSWPAAALYAIALLLIAYFDFKLIQRTCYWGYGLPAVILAPAISWVVPLHLSLIWCLWLHPPCCKKAGKYE